MHTIESRTIPHPTQPSLASRAPTATPSKLPRPLARINSPTNIQPPSPSCYSPIPPSHSPHLPTQSLPSHLSTTLTPKAPPPPQNAHCHSTAHPQKAPALLDAQMRIDRRIPCCSYTHGWELPRRKLGMHVARAWMETKRDRGWVGTGRRSKAWEEEQGTPVKFLFSRYGMCWCVFGSRYFLASPAYGR